MSFGTFRNPAPSFGIRRNKLVMQYYAHFSHTKKYPPEFIYLYTKDSNNDFLMEFIFINRTHRYKGKNCATRDYCISSACRQSSMCVNGQNGYTCSCDMGYTGQYCNTRIDYCGKGNYCKNNGFCTSTLEKATCVCDDFYGGERCEVYYGKVVFDVNDNGIFTSKNSCHVFH